MKQVKSPRNTSQCSRLIFMYLCVVGTLSGFSTLSFAQSGFHRAMGTSHSESAFSIIQTPDSGFVIGGAYEFDGWGTKQLMVVKTDQLGDSLWTRTYGDRIDTSFAKTGSTNAPHSTGNGIFDIKPTSSNGFVATGGSYTFSSGLGDIVVLNLDGSGDTIWTRNYGGTGDDYGYSISQTSDDGFVVTGYTESYGPGIRHGIVLRLDMNGDTVWTAITDGSSIEAFYKGELTTDGGLIATGYTFNDGAGNADVYLVKFDPNGAIEWAKTYGGTQNEYGYSVHQIADNGYIVSGMTESAGQGVQDALLIKTDSLGNSEWIKTYGGESYDGAYDVVQKPGVGYTFIGYTKSFGTLNNEDDFYVVQVDLNGDTTWTRRIGGDQYDIGESIAITLDGGFAILGYSGSMGYGGSDILFMKLDANGDGACHSYGTQTVTEAVPFAESNPTIIPLSGSKTSMARPVIGSTFLRPTNGCDSIFVAVDEALTPQLTIYPNPSAGIFRINGRHDGNLMVINPMGQVVYQGKGNLLDLSGVARGIYILRFQIKGKWFQRKLLKE